MPKKTDSTTKPAIPAAAASQASAPAAAPTKRAVKPAAKTRTGVKKPKTPTLKGKRTTKSAAAPAVSSFTREDVALRAYFISEKRRAQGLSGDEHEDWLEAERQLLAESAKPRKTKKAA